MEQSNLSPPDVVRGMTILDKSKFIKSVVVPVIYVESNVMNAALGAIKDYILKLEKHRPIQIEGAKRIIFLNPDIIKSYNSFPPNQRQYLDELGIPSTNLEFRTITLNYDNWNPHDVICAVIPQSLSFSGYSTIGSIIHLNLKENLLPYKKLIGCVLLDKIKTCHSVVNKLSTIDNIYRNFKMEILAGSSDLKTVVRENGCRFELNFEEVYWNPRLHEEHERIIAKLNKGDIFYDVCCGIGPFAIPVAKKDCVVLANDLNPASCHWLRRNIVLNKVGHKVTVFNEDATVFIKHTFAEHYINSIQNNKCGGSKFHISMNLPALAYTFLPAFRGILSTSGVNDIPDHSLPIIHMYCFVNPNEEKNGAKDLVERTLDVILDNSELEVINVRKVAPNKDMFRITFTLPLKVLLHQCEIDMDVDVDELIDHASINRGQKRINDNCDDAVNCSKKRNAAF